MFLYCSILKAYQNSNHLLATYISRMYLKDFAFYNESTTFKGRWIEVPCSPHPVVTVIVFIWPWFQVRRIQIISEEVELFENFIQLFNIRMFFRGNGGPECCKEVIQEGSYSALRWTSPISAKMIKEASLVLFIQDISRKQKYVTFVFNSSLGYDWTGRAFLHVMEFSKI